MLKLTLSVGDKVEIDGGITLHVLRSGKRMQLGVDAPRAIGVGTVFADPSQQDKNLRKAQQLTPEQQNRGYTR